MKDNSATPAMHDQPDRGGAWAGGDVVDLGTAPDGAAGIPAAAEGPGFDPLRSRVAIAAAFLALFHLVFTVAKLLSPAGGPAASTDAPIWSLLLRSTLAALAFALLRSPLPLSRRQVRCVEGCLFGFEVFLLLAAQYLSAVDLIDRRDLVDAVAVQKNGVMRALLLMICYGVIIPRSPARAARGALTIAAALILCHGLVLHHADTLHLDRDDLVNHQIVMANALFLIMGAALATLAAWLLQGRLDADDGAQSIGPYRLLRRLDAGGMGEVYLAEHDLLQRPCALKLLRHGGTAAAGRFEREMRAAASLSHPNLVAIFDGGHTVDGRPFFAMEYLPGLSVADLVRDGGPLPAARAVYLGRQVCAALAELDRAGFIHRDVSPANVFVSCLTGAGDVAKLLDFGSVGGPAAVADQAPTADEGIAGTPEYVAPEQAVAGAPIDGRADLYALGALLHFMVTGAPPFPRATAADALRAHLEATLPPRGELRADLPADVEAIIRRCLAKRPGDRYAHARALAAALAACAAAADWDAPRAEAWWRARSASPALPSPEAPG
ncbi:MAG: Serine/threonine-protein kinase PknB [Planctomycetota bacterium]|jgi:serine/threonine-protein kinase